MELRYLNFNVLDIKCNLGEKMTFKTTKTIGVLVCGLLLTTPTIATFADQVSSNIQGQNTQAEQTPPKQSRTVIAAADGKLEGNMVPYVKGLDFTGNMTLHYKAKSVGFVDGDTAYLMIKLPKEFERLALAPGFKENITGKVRNQELLGVKEFDIKQDNVSVYSDRILIKVPYSLWVGAGTVNADISIAYGKVLANYTDDSTLKLLLPESESGYEFRTQLKYNSATWDIIKEPIIGNFNEKLVTSETSGIYWQ